MRICQTFRHKFKAVTPGYITPIQLDEIASMIYCGRAVKLDWIKIREKLESVSLIGVMVQDMGEEYLVEDEKVMAVGVIKTPPGSYIERVFSEAGVKEMATEFEYELGYAVTERKYRNMGWWIYMMKHFWSSIKNRNMFSTTSNVKMIHILEAFGFTKVGERLRNDTTLLVYKSEIK